MTLKKIVTGALLLFVAASLVVLIVHSLRTGESAITGETSEGIVNGPLPESTDPDADIDIVYYFMTTQRCPSCMKIEAFTKEAVERNFARQLEGRKLLWRMVNVDEPQNIHFIQDYQLFTKSVVLVKIREGKQVNWKYLDQVWNLLGDKKVFQGYITSEVSTFIKEKS